MSKIYKFQCAYCNKFCEKDNKQRKEYKKSRQQKREFCNKECLRLFNTTSLTMPCGNCGKLVTRTKSETLSSKSGNIFCNSSCAASYNNTLKRKSRRSKCEIMLYSLLKQEFPNTKILANDKTILQGYEIDIAIPEINIGIEWNGIVHYEPIYGDKKLTEIQARDAKKKLLAQEKNIELIIIPDLVSSAKYVKEAFNNICKIIRPQLTSSRNKSSLKSHITFITS